MLTFTGVELKKFKAAFEMYNKGLEEMGYAMPEDWEEEYLIEENTQNPVTTLSCG